MSLRFGVAPAFGAEGFAAFATPLATFFAARFTGRAAPVVAERGAAFFRCSALTDFSRVVDTIAPCRGAGRHVKRHAPSPASGVVASSSGAGRPASSELEPSNGAEPSGF